jgi:endonuclease YncB( thermonuclease family)
MVWIAGFALFAASVAFSHLAVSDNWSRFNHRSFHISGVAGGDSILIETSPQQTETVRLLGIVAPTESDAARTLLGELTAGREATLLLQTPEARDARGSLLASVFVDGTDLSVSLAKAGVVYADRRQPSVMSGSIDPAEAEARKKKRGLWQDLKSAQMPAWRQAWLRGLKNQR